MKTRPILMNGEMVRATLAGRKTQTRRIVRAKDADPSRWIAMPTLMKNIGEWQEQNGRWFGIDGYDTLVFCDCPYGRVGDRLYVRENWCVGNIYDHLAPRDICSHLPREIGKPPCKVAYPASGGCVGLKVRPSILMPKWASRITLEITGVRIERLQCITNADALKEGCVAGERASESDAFHNLWESIYGPDSWRANPWVWCVEFKRIEAPELTHPHPTHHL